MDSLSEWLTYWRSQFMLGNCPTEIKGPFGTHGVLYGEIDFDEAESYWEKGGTIPKVTIRTATIGFVLPSHVTAVGDDGETFNLNGFVISWNEGE